MNEELKQKLRDMAKTTEELATAIEVISIVRDLEEKLANVRSDIEEIGELAYESHKKNKSDYRR